MPSDTPRSLGYRKPADWELHQKCFVAWPAVDAYWEGHVREAQEAFAELCAAIADGTARNEQLNVLVSDERNEQRARKALHNLEVCYLRMPYGDSWLRDTGPVFLTSEKGELAAACFAFNGWGRKYLYPHDDTVAGDLVRALGVKSLFFPWVMEGGAIDSDGEGTCLASRDCLFDKQRNPDQNETNMTERLRQALGFDRILWLDGSLLNDHTDGHVDTLARFVAPGVVICMEPLDHDDPNAAVLREVERQLRAFRDAKGRMLTVERIAAPGPVFGRNQQLLPASYLNFYISNNHVIVPTYGTEHDRRAIDQIAALFPGRRTIGLKANAILEGGGAFHCITLALPAVDRVDL
ncbi:MAG: agmatine deiminase family protein [Deltaproteobacteria bacterium]|nr:agmatine deiminase family protein [Deltaproteobacteria bacterium]